MEFIVFGFCWFLGVVVILKSFLKEIILEKILVRFDKRKKKMSWNIIVKFILWRNLYCYYLDMSLIFFMSEYSFCFVLILVMFYLFIIFI